MPYLSIAQAALERWRVATRAIDAAEIDSEAWKQANLEADQAKADYQKAIDDARAADRPVPAPFDEAAALEPEPAVQFD